MDYFEWVKKVLAEGTVLPKSRTGDGLNYSVNQEKYLRVFLDDGDVPVDNSASERSIRNFCVGKKNFMIINSLKGAHASAVIYSMSETAKLNNLNPYYYFDYLLTELPKYIDYDFKEKKLDTSRLGQDTLEELLPWSDTAKKKCSFGRH